MSIPVYTSTKGRNDPPPSEHCPSPLLGRRASRATPAMAGRMPPAIFLVLLVGLAEALPIGGGLGAPPTLPIWRTPATPMRGGAQRRGLFPFWGRKNVGEPADPVASRDRLHPAFAPPFVGASQLEGNKLSSTARGSISGSGGSSSPGLFANGGGGRSHCCPAGRPGNVARPGRAFQRPGRCTMLLNFLRGGGEKDREAPQATRRASSKRWVAGVDVNPATAVAIAVTSLALVSASLAPGWSPPALSSSYWLARILFLRLLGVVYFVAFTASFKQNTALLGDKGLLPISLWMARARESMGLTGQQINYNLVRNYPTLLWFAPKGLQDVGMKAISLVGMALSATVVLVGGSNVLLQTSLWILYHSICTVGQRWYSFGWESQLLETGFISIFLVPLMALNPLPAGSPTPWVTVWALRWLMLRIMLGAGMIKLRGDTCWRDLTAMCYHYQTQPVPNPFSWFLHHAPLRVHKFETLGNHIVELIAPFLLIMPWSEARVPGALIQITFQAILILSGNLSFLNWLTMLPAILCLDDGFLSSFMPAATGAAVTALNQIPWVWTPLTAGREIIFLSLFVLIVKLSIPVIQNILSENQMMNTSFDPLKLVNTYGAFGSITRNRDEVIIQGTHGDGQAGSEWREYEFKVKPGSVKRRPRFISPYHYRLDWLMWFLPFSDSRRHPWLYHLVAKLLVNDPGVTNLIAANPFEGDEPPRYIRCELYRYEYTKPGSEEAKNGDWWVRRRIGSYLRALDVNDIAKVCEDFNWPDPRLQLMAEGEKKAAALVAAENAAAKKKVAADKVAESKAEGLRIAAAVNAQKAAEVKVEATSAAPPAARSSATGKQQEDAASVLARMRAMEEGGSGVAEVKPAVAESSAAAAAAAAAGSKGEEAKSVAGEGNKEQEGMGLRAKIDEWTGKGKGQSQPPKKAGTPARRVVEESSAAKAAEELMMASSAAAQKAQEEKDAAMARAAWEREEAARRKDEELAGKIAQIEKEEKETADRIASTMAAAKAEEARSKPSSPSTQTMQRQQQEDAASVLARMKAMEEGGSGVAEVKPAVAESSAAAAAAAAQGEAAAAAAAAAPVPQSPPQTKTLARGKVPPPPQTQTLKRGEERDAASSSGGGVSGFWAADKWAGMGRIGGARRETSRDAGGQASKKPRLGSMFRDSGVLKPFRSWAKTWGSIGGGYVDDDDEVGGGEKDKASKAKRVAAVNEKEAKPVLKPRPVNAITPRGGGEYDLPHQVLFDTAAQTVAEAVNSLQPVGGQSDDLPQQVLFDKILAWVKGKMRKVLRS